MQVTTALTPSTAQPSSIHILIRAADLNCLLCKTAASHVSSSHAGGTATLSHGRNPNLPRERWPGQEMCTHQCPGVRSLPWPAFAVDVFPLPCSAHDCGPPAGQRISQGKGFLTELPATSLAPLQEGSCCAHTIRASQGHSQGTAACLGLALFQVQDHHLLWTAGTAVALHYTESQGLKTWFYLKRFCSLQPRRELISTVYTAVSLPTTMSQQLMW